MLNSPIATADRGGRHTLQLREIQTRPPLGYAILMKGIEYMWASGRADFSDCCAILQFCGSRCRRRVGHIRDGCNKLGLGDGSPTAPSGPPAAGSTIFYTAVGASDANGVGSSAECLFLTRCPNGMGYVPVTVRALTAQGFTVNNLNLGIPTTVIGSDFADLGAKYGRTDRRQHDRQRDAVRADQRHRGDHLRRRQRDQHHHRGARRRRRAAAIPTPTSTRR